MTQTPPQLDYAPQAPWHRRRGTRRAFILVAGLLVGLSLWRFGPDAIRRTQLFFLQRKAMTYSVPQGTVAFTVNKEDAKKCIALGNAYTGTDQYNAGLIVAPWRDFYAKYSPPGGPATVAFCHELTSPSGNKRLVVVNIGDRSGNEISFITLSPAVFVPGSLLAAPKQVLMSGYGTAIHGWNSTIYMGQVDPIDASHFTIDVTNGPTRDTLDGYLLDNDTVTLEPRNAGTNVFPKPTTSPIGSSPPTITPLQSTTKAVTKRPKKRKH